jgi:hypothetical protein
VCVRVEERERDSVFSASLCLVAIHLMFLCCVCVCM